jgi:hypothetical protein
VGVGRAHSRFERAIDAQLLLLRQSGESLNILETECVNASIGANVQAVLRRYQGLKVTEPTQWFAGHERLPGIAAKPMKPIVALGAKDPYNRIGVFVRRSCNSGTAAADATAPRGIHCRWRPPGNLQDR